ncbi:hypothetical protein Btru_000602 [Bulinus truncatus]|nr:hypothetical protein Btru_000602 [Bulinus truncatus]
MDTDSQVVDERKENFENESATNETVILTDTVRIKGKDNNLIATYIGLMFSKKSKEISDQRLYWPDVISVQEAEMKSETGVFIIHYIHHSAKNALHLKTLEIEGNSEQWINVINQQIKASQRPRKLFVIINPFGGSGKGQQIYNDTVEPLFKLAGIETSVFGRIVIVGGDGFYQDMLQGLTLQEQKKSSINYNNPEEDLSKLTLPVGIIPAGTGNGFAQFVNGIIDVKTAALNIIRGEQHRAGIFAIYTNNQLLCVSGFMFGYGVLSSMIKRTEELRWMKKMRYPAGILETILKKKIQFPAELHYRLHEEIKAKEGSSSSSTGWIRHESGNKQYCCLYAAPAELMDNGNLSIVNPFGQHFQLGVGTGCGQLTILKGLMTYAMGRKLTSKPGSLEFIDKVTDIKFKITRENTDSNDRMSASDVRNREIELILNIDGEIIYLQTPEFIIRLQPAFVPVYGPNLGRVSTQV